AARGAHRRDRPVVRGDGARDEGAEAKRVGEQSISERDAAQALELLAFHPGRKELGQERRGHARLRELEEQPLDLALAFGQGNEADHAREENRVRRRPRLGRVTQPAKLPRYPALEGLADAVAVGDDPLDVFRPRLTELALRPGGEVERA